MQSFVEGEGDRRWLEVVRALGESFQFLFNIDCDTGVAVAYRAEKGVPEGLPVRDVQTRNTAERLLGYAARGAHDGFTGMMALHPAQVPIINAAFTPTDAQVAHAERIVAAFAAAPNADAS